MSALLRQIFSCLCIGFLGLVWCARAWASPDVLRDVVFEYATPMDPQRNQILHLVDLFPACAAGNDADFRLKPPTELVGTQAVLVVVSRQESCAEDERACREVSRWAENLKHPGVLFLQLPLGNDRPPIGTDRATDVSTAARKMGILRDPHGLIRQQLKLTKSGFILLIDSKCKVHRWRRGSAALRAAEAELTRILQSE